MKPPTVHEITEYCKEREYSVDPVQFHVYYEDCDPPWTVPTRRKGIRKPMTSWRSCMATWERNIKDTTSFVNVKKREVKYNQEKGKHVMPVKPKKVNPKLKKLADEYYALGKELRTAKPFDRGKIKMKRALMVRDMQVLRDDSTNIGNVLRNG